MSLMQKVFLGWVLALIAVPAFGQQMPAQVYQLSGLIVNKSAQQPVPYARVRVNHSRRGGFANLEGFYSIPVYATDTVYFGSLGYKSSFLVVADYLEDYKGDLGSSFIYAISYLTEDSITLPTATIFPYNTYRELRTAMVETEIPDMVENINARDNLDPGTLDNLMESLKIDEGERIMVARQIYYNEHLQRNVAPTATLFDPMAIYQLLRYINDRTKERRTKDLDYWSE